VNAHFDATIGCPRECLDHRPIGQDIGGKVYFSGRCNEALAAAALQRQAERKMLRSYQIAETLMKEYFRI
jgi:hypothetical protein